MRVFLQGLGMLGALCLVQVAWAGPALDQVRDFMGARVIGKEFKSPMTSLGEYQDETTGKVYLRQFSREATYGRLESGKKSFSFEYSVKVTWQYFPKLEDGTFSQVSEKTDLYDSVLRFDLQEFEGHSQKLWGLARFTKNEKNGKPQELAAKFYRIAVGMGSDAESMSIEAEMILPVTNTNNPQAKEELAYFDFKEVLKYGEGVLSRRQSHSKVEALKPDLKRGEPIGNPTEILDEVRDY